jgi:hypothetical protein
MIIRSWDTIKVIYCHHADTDVGMQADVVYPPEWLPDQPPRVLGHRCSHGAECNLMGKPSCIWAGTNPNFDPFLEHP